MNTSEQVEEHLTRMTSPSLIEGPHRAALRAELLAHSKQARRSSRIRTRIAVVFAAMCVGAAGWAAQEFWRTYIVEHERGPEIVLPDGTVGVTERAVSITSNDPNFSREQADRKWAAMKAAIDAGDYALTEVREVENGLLVYLYEIYLDTGEVVSLGSSVPLGSEELDGGDQQESE
jgi:hypothetical protein